MAMKGYATLSRALEPKPHHRMQSNIISRTPFLRGSYSSEDGTVGVFETPKKERAKRKKELKKRKVT